VTEEYILWISDAAGTVQSTLKKPRPLKKLEKKGFPLIFLLSVLALSFSSNRWYLAVF
jgi:hypothetical protein